MIKHPCGLVCFNEMTTNFSVSFFICTKKGVCREIRSFVTQWRKIKETGVYNENYKNDRWSLHVISVNLSIQCFIKEIWERNQKTVKLAILLSIGKLVRTLTLHSFFQFLIELNFLDVILCLCPLQITLDPCKLFIEPFAKGIYVGINKKG